jgi:hypothetical protein
VFNEVQTGKMTKMSTTKRLTIVSAEYFEEAAEFLVGSYMTHPGLLSSAQCHELQKCWEGRGCAGANLNKEEAERILADEFGWRHYISTKQYELWMAKRRAAGELIDPATAQFDWTYGQDMDPYGDGLELSPEMEQVGRQRFFQEPKSGIWVDTGDLPQYAWKAVWERVEKTPGAIIRIGTGADGKVYGSGFPNSPDFPQQPTKVDSGLGLDTPLETLRGWVSEKIANTPACVKADEEVSDLTIDQVRAELRACPKPDKTEAEMHRTAALWRRIDAQVKEAAAS